MENILSVKTTSTRNLSYKHITDNIVYYEDVNETKIDDRVINHVTGRGFATLDNIKKVKDLDSVDYHIPVEWMYQGTGAVIGIPNELYNDIITGKKFISDIYDWRESKYDPENFVYCITNSGSFELADLDGTPIPLPVFFNYIDGRITDRYFDLNNLLKYLKEHPDKFIVNCFSKNTELCITDIPYYNADDYTGFKQIMFAYIPSQDEANELSKIRGSFEKNNYIINNTELHNFKLK